MDDVKISIIIWKLETSAKPALKSSETIKISS